MVMDCAIASGIAAGVVGVALANFAAAIAAFKAVFTACITDKVGELISCLDPGLAIIDKTVTDRHDWV